MPQANYRYDEISDTLYISFGPGRKATGFELSEHLLLRMDRAAETPVGLTVFDYSILAQETEAGPRSFPLEGLEQLSADVRAMVLRVLRRPPLSDVLALSNYSPSIAEGTPITSLQPLPVAVGE
jgi:hypothetical protein